HQQTKTHRKHHGSASICSAAMANSRYLRALELAQATDLGQRRTMSWEAKAEQRRKLSAEEKRRRRIATIPESVARTMAFEGEPISWETLKKIKALIERRSS